MGFFIRLHFVKSIKTLGCIWATRKTDYLKYNYYMYIHCLSK